MTPQLRFPGFTGDWQVKKLGDVTKVMQSGLSRKLSSEDIGLPVIRSNNIQNQQLDVSNLSYWYKDDPQGANTKNYILQKNDLLINFINSQSQIGKFTLYNDELGRDTIFTTNIMRLRFDDLVIPRFMVLSLNSKRYEDYIESITKPAVNQASFTTVDLKKYKISVPSKSEQEKIAGFMGAVDDKVAAIQNKVTAMHEYKKGVMQVLFSGKLRFRDENNNPYPDWEEKPLGKVFEFVRTNSLSRSALWDGEGIKNIHYGDIHTKLPIQLDASSYPLPKINIPNLVFPHKDFCKPGDLVMADVSEDYADIGKCLEIIAAGEREVVAGLHTILLRPRSKLAMGFSGYLMSSGFTRKQLVRIATGVSVLGISKSNLTRLFLRIPCLEEQQKIADFLSAVDAKIELENKKLQQAKQFKKSLLQRMFV